MDQFERMKVTRQAMNGRMCLMFGGIFLMFSAITSTIMYGINFFMTALEADKGTAEYVELLENAGVGSGLLKGIGICFIAVDPARKKSSQQSQPAAPKKSIRERAAMQAREDAVVPEKQDTVDEEDIADSEESN